MLWYLKFLNDERALPGARDVKLYNMIMALKAVVYWGHSFSREVKQMGQRLGMQDKTGLQNPYFRYPM
jgi:hypothetical protein